ncbi:hypothetical protein [Microbacterium sulfonylureivorans]|uniref:hypothetical protein n=1 Tax=Microbacterium sulfonylureivorans TaxID=2486854 RepID=UPI000FD74D38|nr:hypothetical protein [Microbacterium sulfonylureivorans]
MKLDEASAVLGQRSADRRWVVVIPVEFEAMRHGEQHCVMSLVDGVVKREFVESGESWPEGEYETWLQSSVLPFES